MFLNFFAKIGFSFLLFKVIAISSFQNVYSTAIQNSVIRFHRYAADPKILSEVIHPLNHYSRFHLANDMNNTFIATYFDWDHRTPRKRHRLANRVLNKFRLNGQVIPKTPGMANVEARMNIFHLASQTAAYKVSGDVVEVGCNAGESSIAIQKVLHEYAPEKQFHVFDSFEGLPELKRDDIKDGIYDKGSMTARLDEFKKNFSDVGLDLPHIHKGWFEDTVPSCLPDKISFAVVDCDLYSSTKYVLPYVYERLTPGAICFFGVYYDEKVFSRPYTAGPFKSPGVKRACDEFFADKPEKVSVLYACEYSNGYFRKL